MKEVLSLNYLAWRVGVPLARLHEIADNIVPHYRLRVLKTGDKARFLYVPEPELMRVLRRIKKMILDPLPLEDSAHGGVSGQAVLSSSPAFGGVSNVPHRVWVWQGRGQATHASNDISRRTATGLSY
jgi:hypothetical protein